MPDFIELSDEEGNHEKSKALQSDKDSSKNKDDKNLHKSLDSKQGKKEIIVDFITSQEKYDCIHCMKQFNEQSSLTSHIKNFHKIYEHKCFKCRKFFDHSSELADHLKSTHFFNIHMVDKHSWCKCSTCKQIFKQKEILATHTKSVHEGIKNKCVLCENMKTFRSNFSLINHLKFVHKEEKIVTCILINMNRKSLFEGWKNLNDNKAVKKLQSRSLNTAVDQVDEDEVIDLVDEIDNTNFNQLTTPEILKSSKSGQRVNLKFETFSLAQATQISTETVQVLDMKCDDKINETQSTSEKDQDFPQNVDKNMKASQKSIQNELKTLQKAVVEGQSQSNVNGIEESKNLAAVDFLKNIKDDSIAISGNMSLDKPQERRFSSRLLSSTEISTVYWKIVKKKKRAKFTHEKKTKNFDLNELLIKENQCLIKQEQEEFAKEINKNSKQFIPFLKKTRSGRYQRPTPEAQIEKNNNFR